MGDADTFWSEMRDRLAAAVHRAARGGEPVLLGPGGWDTAGTPACTIGVYDDGAVPMAVVAARPAPTGARLWQGFRHTHRRRRSRRRPGSIPSPAPFCTPSARCATGDWPPGMS